jgi:DNA-binding NarL/FixJ family response regulator
MNCWRRTSSVPTARILIVDSHPIVRAGLRQIIAREADLLVCAETDTVPGAPLVQFAVNWITV